MIEVPTFKRASEAARWIADMLGPDTWTVGAFALDADDKEVNIDRPEAAKFCSLGWIRKADQGFEIKLENTLTQIIGETINESEDDDDWCLAPEITEWNDADHRTVDQVKSIFLKTAKRLEANND